ncbi:hypothetical protein SKAU_G00160090 [Synaphobranchus kaupii]|uniref:Uncharacterized protein n=1 Tax=Synaphobranchus kaupii TaxID=118154 RepID=A0A9Q1FIR7_SYNKA|nr:hypothetical protein SKAU_G00160090 [Synaphobranchus kaupii]
MPALECSGVDVRSEVWARPRGEGRGYHGVRQKVAKQPLGQQESRERQTAARHRRPRRLPPGSPSQGGLTFTSSGRIINLNRTGSCCRPVHPRPHTGGTNQLRAKEAQNTVKGPLIRSLVGRAGGFGGDPQQTRPLPKRSDCRGKGFSFPRRPSQSSLAGMYFPTRHLLRATCSELAGGGQRRQNNIWTSQTGEHSRAPKGNAPLTLKLKQTGRKRELFYRRTQSNTTPDSLGRPTQGWAHAQQAHSYPDQPQIPQVRPSLKAPFFEIPVSDQPYRRLPGQFDSNGPIRLFEEFRGVPYCPGNTHT